MIATLPVLTFITVFIQGCASGLLGCFLFLKRESLLVDALSHACFPGIALAYVLHPGSTLFLPLLTGTATAAIGHGLITYIKNHTLLKRDTALGVVLSTFFGIGLVIITIIQKHPVESQGRLRAYLLGNITTLLPYDLYCICAISLFSMSVLLFLARPLTSAIFDPSFAKVHIIARPWHHLLHHLIILLTVLAGLQTSGIILTSAMMIAPAIFARAITNHLYHMRIVAGITAGLTLMTAYYVSSRIHHVPPGPVAILLASTLAFGALFINRIGKHNQPHIGIGN